MKLDIRVEEKTADVLREIADLHDCSVEMAARTVLERYSERTKGEIQRAHKALDRHLGKGE